MTRSSAQPQDELVRRLQSALDESASGATRAWWGRYLKGEIEFRGVGIPQIRSVLADWRSESGVAAWPIQEQLALALRLFEGPMAEDKLSGVLFLQEYLFDRVPWREGLRSYGSLFERGLIADWNTCDWFCVRVLGPTIATHGGACAASVARWSKAPILWKARASLVGFVPVIADPAYHSLVLRSAAVLIRREERFAKTAVGWVLRDLSKHDSGAVQAFVDQNLRHFSTESLRNALKYSPESARLGTLKSMRAAQQQHAPDGALRGPR